MILSDPNLIYQSTNSYSVFAVLVPIAFLALSILIAFLAVKWTAKSNPKLVHMWNSFRRSRLKVPDTIVLTKQDFTTLLDSILAATQSGAPAEEIKDIAFNSVSDAEKKAKKRKPKIIAIKHEKFVYEDEHVSIYQLPDTEFVIYFKDFDKTMYFDLTSQRQNDVISRVVMLLNDKPIMAFDAEYI